MILGPKPCVGVCHCLKVEKSPLLDLSDIEVAEILNRAIVGMGRLIPYTDEGAALLSATLLGQGIAISVQVGPFHSPVKA